jgi:hypothetical protein
MTAKELIGALESVHKDSEVYLRGDALVTKAEKVWYSPQQRIVYLSNDSLEVGTVSYWDGIKKLASVWKRLYPERIYRDRKRIDL